MRAVAVRVFPVPVAMTIAGGGVAWMLQVTKDTSEIRADVATLKGGVSEIKATLNRIAPPTVSWPSSATQAGQSN